MLLVVNDQMKELGLSLTDEEKEAISTTTEEQWTNSSATLTKYGIAKTSFDLAYSEFYTKYQKIFNAIYGKGVGSTA